MFSYYGSKSKIVDYYPPPKFDKIIEPFAGSARYSLKYWDRHITLIDKYDVIVDVWKWLRQCSKDDVLNLPIIKKDTIIKNLDITNEEKLFLGLTMVNGVESPRDKISSWNLPKHREVLNSIANNLHKIKHWKILKGCYTELQNIESTWFVDPPYQFGGEHYKESNKALNFTDLAKWCKSRKGQVIVCENTKADWMDFKPMITMNGTIHKTTEAIWTNYPTSYAQEQLTIFSK